MQSHELELKRTILRATIPGRILKYMYRFKQPMAIHLSDLDLVYVPIPKVANSSIKTSLASKCDITFEKDIHNVKWKKISQKELSKLNYPVFKFSFVRNPFDRLVSCYTNKIGMGFTKNQFWKYGNLVQDKMSFKEFAIFVCNMPNELCDSHFKPQTEFLYYNNSLIVDHIFKFEQLENDWKQIQSKFELPGLDHINQSKSITYQSFYDLETAELVKNKYITDIENFGYTKEAQTLFDSVE